MRRKPTRRRAGFSLIELLAALTLFSVGVVACLELFTVCLRSTSSSLEYTQAVYLAKGLMEQTLAEGYLITKTDSGDFGTAWPNHTWETEIRETEQTGLMEVRVVIAWTARGRNHQYMLTTLHSDRYLTETTNE